MYLQPHSTSRGSTEYSVRLSDIPHTLVRLLSFPVKFELRTSELYSNEICRLSVKMQCLELAEVLISSNRDFAILGQTSDKE